MLESYSQAVKPSINDIQYVYCPKKKAFILKRSLSTNIKELIKYYIRL